MAATVSRFILNSDGRGYTLVHPDKDTQLDDPAFAPNGTVQCDVPRGEYSALPGNRNLLPFLQPYVAMNGGGVLADILQAKIDLHDAANTKQAANVANAELTEETGPNPNAVQKIALAKCKAKCDAAETAHQAASDKLQELLAQVQ